MADNDDEHDDKVWNILCEYINYNEIGYSFEGTTGVDSMCKLVRGLGYKDPMNFGPLKNGACFGDLICFLGDNPDALKSLFTELGVKPRPRHRAGI